MTTAVPPGALLDERYRIDEVLGHGGMATVYRASDTVLGREVALKLFPPALDESDRLRHEAEIGLLAQLSHPGLVALYDAGAAVAGNDDPQTFIVMELVRGRTLADLLLGGALPAGHVAGIGYQLADALAAVHEAQIVHRDVKPGNVLLVEAADGATPPMVKLADFGIARLADAARLTVTGTTVGTAAYLSPEQAAGEAVDAPSDVYALGLVLLECLTGRKAFEGTVAEVATARVTTEPAIPTELGAGWVSLLRDMTRRRPVDRTPMTEVRSRLADLVDVPPESLVLPPQAGPALGVTAVLPEKGTTADLAAAPPHAQTVRARRRLMVLTGAGVAALALAAAALMSTQPAGEDVARVPVPVEGPLGAALEDLVGSVQP